MRLPCFRLCRSLSRRLDLRGWQYKRKCAALPDLAVNPDSPTHHLDQLLRDRQAQPSTAVFARGRAICLTKLVKDNFLVFALYADTRIDHGSPDHRLAVLVLDLDVNRYASFFG